MSYTPNSTRYSAMMYRNAGKSGLKLPAISLGFWHNFGNYNNVQDMKAICLPHLTTELHISILQTTTV